MYLRQSLQKQPVQVSYASLGYKVRPEEDPSFGLDFKRTNSFTLRTLSSKSKVNDVSSFEQPDKSVIHPESRVRDEKAQQPANQLCELVNP